MKARDYQLVKEGKFNLKAIMQRAWAYVRNEGYSLKTALKNSWMDARIAMKEFKLSECPLKFNMNIDLIGFYAMGKTHDEVLEERKTLQLSSVQTL